MWGWARFAITLPLGLVAGGLLAAHAIRTGLDDAPIVAGAWTTATTYGSTAADPLTRARVALRGLLALPAEEALYYAATADDQGRALNGRCSYRLTGGAIPARWWSVTLYDQAGWLVPNPERRYSVGSGAMPKDATNWTIEVGPGDDTPAEGPWIPTGRPEPFALTLRVYNAAPALLADPGSLPAPRIERLECAA